MAQSPASQPSNEDDLPIPLEPEDPRPAPRPPVIAQHRPAPAKCPKCNYSLAGLHEPKRCPECGVNFESLKKTPSKGAPVKPEHAPQVPTGGLKCPGCGYALAGLQDPKKCPECGVPIDMAQLTRELRRAIRIKDAAMQGRREYVKPLLMIAAGLAVVGIMAALQGEPLGILWAILGVLIQTPIGVVVFFLCSMMWIGFDAPWGLTTVRLAAIYAVSGAVAALLDPLPIPIVPLLITVAVYVGLLMEMLELEMRDAMLVGFITGAVKIAIVFVVAMMIA